ncbi:MAG: hypothetical protein ACLQPD_34895 [Desulfomonilaceae bacterium]
MDDIQKSRIRLEHWINHNLDHIKGYDEVAQLLYKNNFSGAAEMIRRGTRLIEAANSEFQKALKSIESEDQTTNESGAGADSESHSHEHSH